jgi:hypothetical protein
MIGLPDSRYCHLAEVDFHGLLRMQIEDDILREHLG